MGVSEIKIRKWFYNQKFYNKISMWNASGSDCKSESKNKYKRFKSHEVMELKRIFENNHYPDKNIRNDLAQRMGIPEIKIHRWFQVTRYRLKKYVSSLTCAEGCYENFITSSTDDINYPSFYFRAETMPPDYSYRHSQSLPDFSAGTCARARACVCVCVVCVCVCVCVCVWAKIISIYHPLLILFLLKSYVNLIFHRTQYKK